ncbi:MAG TPA: large conductance mechanosensitive channel protein MscL [Gemmatimonadales bacterium]|jgi:large conductance mechanosensitive channel|nr:large conductance mechanosensitive channel protein MscL [Gemmatimonadales bacterium]
MLKGFRDFVMRGNVLDLAVAVIIGAAFTKVVNSMVDDIIMPPLGLLLGKVDFANLFVVLREGAKAAGPYATLADAKAAGAATLNYGLFISTIVTFVIVAFVIYLIVKSVTRLGPKKADTPATTKDCPYCLSKIPLNAKKCAFCTADLSGGRA